VKRSAGVLPGWRFLINQRGVATICRQKGELCRGGLWRISQADEWALDQFEGIASGFYRKETVRVRTPKGKIVEAMTYVDPRALPGIPRTGYLLRVIAGALHFNLPHDYLLELVSWASEEDLAAWRLQA
jgi:cation transport regulator ChaC